MPLYFAFVEAPNVFYDNEDVIEAVTFHALQRLLAACGMGPLWIDWNRKENAERLMDAFGQALTKESPKLAKHLAKLNCAPFVYAYRWLTILFAQEFEMPDLLVLWDGLLAHQNHMVDYAIYIGITIITILEPVLIDAEFHIAIARLQSFGGVSSQALLERTNQFWRKRVGSGMPFLEDFL